MTSPPTVRRWAAGRFAVLAASAALLFNALLMLSDRAPGALRRIGGDFVRRLFDRIDASDRPPRCSPIRACPRATPSSTSPCGRSPSGWSGWPCGRGVGLVIGAVAVFAASLVVEAAQGRWSDTRAVEASDVRANAVGVVVGTVAVGVCYVAYSAIGGLFRVTSRRGYPTT